MSPQNNNPIDLAELCKLAESWRDMMGCISHNLTSPLVLIRGVGEYLQVLPKLVQGYKIAVEKGLIESDIQKGNLRILEELAPDVLPVTTEVIKFINLLPAYSAQLISTSEKIKVLGALSSIDNLLDNYQFADQKERSLIEVARQHDFKFKCASIFIESLLFNFLSNALAHIKWANKGKIKIWIETNNNSNLIHFKDTADGMDEYVLPDVFKRFFSKRDAETIPGLGFCRLAILQMGGDVWCNSIKGEYTHFIVKFPMISNV